MSCLPSASLAADSPDSPRRPNIVFMVADDLGYGHLGCYGQKKIRTPSIDRMASEGTRFTQFYAGHCVCAPSRSTLMTGYHTGHTSVRVNGGGSPLLPEDVTVAEVLKRAGYTCGGFGKWGLGDDGATGLPYEQGFDEFFGYLHQVHAHFYYSIFSGGTTASSRWRKTRGCGASNTRTTLSSTPPWILFDATTPVRPSSICR